MYIVKQNSRHIAHSLESQISCSVTKQ